MGSRVGDAERTTPGRGAPTSHHNTTTITTALVSVSNCIQCSQNSRHENSLAETTNSEIYIDQEAALALSKPHLRILPPSSSGHSQHGVRAGPPPGQGHGMLRGPVPHRERGGRPRHGLLPLAALPTHFLLRVRQDAALPVETPPGGG